ncbi:MAG: hypothetical protein M3Z11_10570 [Candidatus Dormibacteraeota bacterium]|nr:hypothetical protein [Candidatus Dormibacteraeota bacterium]
MSGALDPIQEELPFDVAATPPVPIKDVSATPIKDVVRPLKLPDATPIDPADLPPSIYEQVWQRLRALPWQRWRNQATPVVHSGVQQLGSGVQHLGTVAQAAVTRGTPYTVKLARATVKVALIRAFPLLIARTIHLFGFPAVVLRTALQAAIAYRLGLAVDEVTYFRVDDPAGYTVYEAPARLSSALAIAYVPALVLFVLAAICLTPALTPRAVLHLPVTWLTWVQVWLGLAFAAHALPAYEEAGPVAEQARVGVTQADPVAVFWIIPAQAVALLTRLGGILPAVIGVVLTWWLAGAILR